MLKGLAAENGGQLAKNRVEFQCRSLKRVRAEFRRGVRVHDQKVEFEFELDFSPIV